MSQGGQVLHRSTDFKVVVECNDVGVATGHAFEDGDLIPDLLRNADSLLGSRGSDLAANVPYAPYPP